MHRDDLPVGLEKGNVSLAVSKPHAWFRSARIALLSLCFYVAYIALRPSNLPTDIAADPRLERYQTPANASYCTDWAQGSADLYFELPTNADLLFFLSRGSVFGRIHLTRTWADGPVKVNVTAHYHNVEDLLRTQVCRMGLYGEHGLLLWSAPRHPHGDPSQDVLFDITVTFPRVDYNDLTTDLPLFTHDFDKNFGTLGTPFKDIRLKSSNAPIYFDRLGGRKAFIQTTNGRVEGLFGGSELEIHTSNAPIVTVGVMFDNATGSEARVHLKTSNGPIQSQMGLVTYGIDNKLVGLRAVVRTSNAPLAIALTREEYGDTLNRSIFLDAATSVGAAQVRVYPSYEGTYDLETSFPGDASVREYSDRSDGQGRYRTITRTRVGRQAQGVVFWSEDGEPISEGIRRGSVKVKTSVQSVNMYV